MYITRPVTLHVLFYIKSHIIEFRNFVHREVYQTEHKIS